MNVCVFGGNIGDFSPTRRRSRLHWPAAAGLQATIEVPPSVDTKMQFERVENAFGAKVLRARSSARQFSGRGAKAMYCEVCENTDTIWCGYCGGTGLVCDGDYSVMGQRCLACNASGEQPCPLLPHRHPPMSVPTHWEWLDYLWSLLMSRAQVLGRAANSRGGPPSFLASSIADVGRR